MSLKLGCLPPVHTPESVAKGIILSEHLLALGPPPRNSDDYVSAVEKQVGTDWQMLGNNVAGNCTIADCGHEHMLWTANTGTIETPTDQYCLDYYKQLSGWNGVPDDPSDTGLMIAAVCSYLEKTGFMGNQLQGYADVSPANFDLVKWGIQLFGCVKLGLQLPQSAMDQFEASKPWKFVSDFNIKGGHDVTAVGYEHNLLKVVSWARCFPMGPSFALHYVTEVKVPLAINWTRLAGVAPNKLDMPQLIRDLAQEGPVY